MLNNSTEEFNEDCTMQLWDLANVSPRSTADREFTYANININSLSDHLGIKWETSKSSPFGEEVAYLVSNGTCDCKSYTYLIKRKPGIWQSSLNGGRSPRMIFAKHRGYTENFCMQCWSSLQGKLTSPTWRPCLPLSIAVHSAHIPLPEAPLTISTGGNTSFVRLSS